MKETKTKIKSAFNHGKFDHKHFKEIRNIHSEEKEPLQYRAYMMGYDISERLDFLMSRVTE